MARQNQHAAKHAGIAEHPVTSSLEPGEDWMWCYAGEVDLELPRASARSR